MAVGRQDLMVSSVEGRLPQEPWQQALGAVRALLQATSAFQSDYPGTLELLRRALRSPEEETAALLMLGLLETDYSAALVDQLVSASLSHRNALRVRQILGRLPHDQAERVVPPAVWRQLQETGDYDAYRRMAELLSHLGLHGALSQLSDQALKSSDPDIREVGEDFAG
jgi:hypothetical protein